MAFEFDKALLLNIFKKKLFLNSFNPMFDEWAGFFSQKENELWEHSCCGKMACNASDILLTPDVFF